MAVKPESAAAVAKKAAKACELIKEKNVDPKRLVFIEGAMTDVMSLIDMKPLNYPTKFGIDPKELLGKLGGGLGNLL